MKSKFRNSSSSSESILQNDMLFLTKSYERKAALDLLEIYSTYVHVCLKWWKQPVKISKARTCIRFAGHRGVQPRNKTFGVTHLPFTYAPRKLQWYAGIIVYIVGVNSPVPCIYTSKNGRWRHPPWSRIIVLGIVAIGKGCTCIIAFVRQVSLIRGRVRLWCWCAR